jgi:hypothetical protein
MGNRPVKKCKKNLAGTEESAFINSLRVLARMIARDYLSRQQQEYINASDGEKQSRPPQM